MALTLPFSSPFPGAIGGFNNINNYNNNNNNNNNNICICIAPLPKDTKRCCLYHYPVRKSSQSFRFT